MRIKSAITLSFWLLVTACQPKGKSEIASALGIAEPKEWILIINPEGCKTCLDSFYTALMELPENSPGIIIILAKNTKTLRLNPLIENSPIPLYLDEEKKLIQKGFLEKTDQILLFRSSCVEHIDILEYQKVFQYLRLD